MASITPTVNNTLSTEDRSLVLWKWVLTSVNSDGLPLAMPEWADVTWSIGAVGDAVGTGAGFRIEGSNDGVTYATLNNAAAGAPITTGVVTGVVATSIENPLFIRPNIGTPGAGATVTFYALVRRANPLRT